MSLEKIILDTETILRVDLDFMNQTHFEEIEMVELLGKLVVAYQQSETRTEKNIVEINEALNAWLEHTRAHFERENELMIDINFPAYPIHSREHTTVLDDMQSVVTSWERTKDIDDLAEYVFSSWPEWFDAHVGSMDLMTAKFAVMQGYQADSCPPVSS